MKKPKKDLASPHRHQETKLCLNCGFPSRASDKRCMYCNTSLFEETGLFPWVRQTFYILRWRWHLKQKRGELGSTFKQHKSAFYLFGYFIIGAILCGAGLYLLSNAVTENSFSSGLIAVLFLFYGVFTFRSLFLEK